MLVCVSGFLSNVKGSHAHWLSIIAQCFFPMRGVILIMWSVKSGFIGQIHEASMSNIFLKMMSLLSSKQVVTSPILCFARQVPGGDPEVVTWPCLLPWWWWPGPCGGSVNPKRGQYSLSNHRDNQTPPWFLQLGQTGLSQVLMTTRYAWQIDKV